MSRTSTDRGSTSHWSWRWCSLHQGHQSLHLSLAEECDEYLCNGLWYRCLWKKIFLSCEPLPCSPAAETALQILIRCSQCWYSNVYYFPEECFFTDTGIHTHAPAKNSSTNFILYPSCHDSMFYKSSWAWAWVWMSKPTTAVFLLPIPEVSIESLDKS